MLPSLQIIEMLLSVLILAILCLEITYGLDTKFPYDINPGPVNVEEFMNITNRREKRETDCEVREGNFNRWQKIQLRQAHNEYRRHMSLTGANILRLDWKIHLAKRAQALADTCVYGHDYLRECCYTPGCTGKRMGQNLFVTWGNTVFPELDPAKVVEAWHEEINYYDMTLNSCTAVCGHYKQVVWGKTQYFGCGVAYCDVLIHPGSVDKKKAVYVVCDYSPAGNYADGRPYTVGEPCSGCPDDKKCQNNLCIPK